MTSIDFRSIFNARKMRKDDRRLNIADAVTDEDIDELADDIADDGEDTDDETKRHHIDQLADLVVEASGDRWTRAQALSYMMNTPHGAALVHRLRRSVGKALNKRKENSTMKNWPDRIVSIAKGIADSGHSSISEADLTAAITSYAKYVYPNLTPAAAFVKVFEAHDDAGLAFRKATQIAKGLEPIMPVANDGDESVDDPEDALAQLEELVERMRAAHPELSKAQAFAKVYENNPALAAAERRQNRPRA